MEISVVVGVPVRVPVGISVGVLADDDGGVVSWLVDLTTSGKYTL